MSAMRKFSTIKFHRKSMRSVQLQNWIRDERFSVLRHIFIFFASFPECGDAVCDFHLVEQIISEHHGVVRPPMTVSARARNTMRFTKIDEQQKRKKEKRNSHLLSKFNCEQPKLFLHELWREAFTIFSVDTNVHRYFFCGTPNESGSVVGMPLKPGKLPAPNGIASIWNVPRYNVALLSPAFTGSNEVDGDVGAARDKFGCCCCSSSARGSWKLFWAVTVSSKKRNETMNQNIYLLETHHWKYSETVKIFQISLCRLSDAFYFVRNFVKPLCHF